MFFVVVVATGRVNSKRGKEDKRTVGKNSAERQKKKTLQVKKKKEGKNVVYSIDKKKKINFENYSKS